MPSSKKGKDPNAPPQTAWHKLLQVIKTIPNISHENAVDETNKAWLLCDKNERKVDEKIVEIRQIAVKKQRPTINC
jgi:hypothetical protein